jgi:hypothetical protein
MGNEAYTNPHPPLTQPQFGLSVFCESSSYWLTGREDDSDEGSRQYSSPVSVVCNRHIFTFSFLSQGDEPTGGSHFSILLHIWPLKNI